MAAKNYEDMTDEELDAELAKKQAAPEIDYDKMSDEELDKAIEMKLKNKAIEAERPWYSMTPKGAAQGFADALPAMGGIAGGIAGGVGGAGIGGGLGESAKNVIESIMGQPKTTQDTYLKPLQTGAEMATGEGVGQAIGQGVGKVYNMVKEPIKKGVTKVASTISGMAEDSISQYANNPAQINQIIKEYGTNIGDYADDIRERMQDAIKSFRQGENQKISQGLQEYADKKVSVTPVVVSLQMAKAKINPKLSPEKIAQIDSMIDLVYSLVGRPSGESMLYGGAKSGKVGGTISPDDMFSIQNILREKTTYKPDGNFFPSDSIEGRAFKNAAAVARKEINKAAPKVAAANTQLAELHALEEVMHKNLTTPGKTDTTLMAAGRGANPRNQKNLQRLNDLVGGDNFVEEVKNLSAAKDFHNPNMLSGLNTGRAVLPLMMSQFVGNSLGIPAGIAAGVATTPWGIKQIISKGSQMGGMMPNISGLAGPMGQQITKDKLSPMMSNMMPQPQEPMLQGFPISQTQQITPDMYSAHESEVMKNPNLTNTQKSKRIKLIRDNGRIYLGQ